MRAAALALFFLACTSPSKPTARVRIDAPMTISNPSRPPTTRVLSIAPRSRVRTLVVLLHGYGASADDLLGVARELSTSLGDTAFLLPDGIHPSSSDAGRQWWSVLGMTEQNRGDRIRAAADELDAWLDGQLASREISSRSLVLLGFSQGAALAMEMASRRALRAVVSLCGRPVERSSPIAGTPMLLVFGARDTLITRDDAERGAAALRARGARVSMRIHPQLGHAIDRAAIVESDAFLRSIEEP